MGFFKKTLCEKIMEFSITIDDIYKVYLKNNDEINSTQRGMTPLCCAIFQYLNGYYKIDLVQNLLKFGANPNQFSVVKGKKLTPLMCSCMGDIWTEGYARIPYDSSRFLELEELLVAFGANINQKCEEGNTALIYASQSCFWDVAESLARFGADPTIKRNHDGKRAFEILLDTNKMLKLVGEKTTQEYVQHIENSKEYYNFQDYDSRIKKKGYGTTIQKNNGWEKIGENTIKDVITFYSDKEKKHKIFPLEFYIQKTNYPFEKSFEKEAVELANKISGGYNISISFKALGWKDTEGICFAILYDFEKCENSCTIVLNYKIEDTKWTLTVMRGIQNQVFMDFLKGRRKVYVHLLYDDKIPQNTNFDFYLKNIDEVEEYFEM